jgi:hypothetical protein
MMSHKFLLVLAVAASANAAGSLMPGSLEDAPIPGSAADPRGIAGPLPEDTRRISDGISSWNPLSNTGPSFAEYHGSLRTSVNLGRDESQALENQRHIQGIARPGAGSFERELARYRVNEEGPGEAPSMTFAVNATHRTVASGFPIQAGELYKITANSNQTWIDAGVTHSSAQGYAVSYSPQDRCWLHDGLCQMHLNNAKARAPVANWMQLVCGVIERWQTLRPATNARYIALADGKLSESHFPVGLEVEFTARHTGELVCFANDAEGQYFDNEGAIDVTVTRLNWPPAGGPYNPNYEPYFLLAPT